MSHVVMCAQIWSKTTRHWPKVLYADRGGTTRCAYSDRSNEQQQTGLTAMKLSRQIFLCGMLAAAVMAVAPSARAQVQVTGELGSPSATTTIDGKQLPPPDPTFGGVIKEKVIFLKLRRPP